MGGAVLVGCHRLFFHRLPVGVTQLDSDFFRTHGLVDDMVGMLGDDGGHMHSLPRPIDAAVGEEVGLDAVAVVVVVAEVVVGGQDQGEAVAGCEGEHRFPPPVIFLGILPVGLTVTVGGQLADALVVVGNIDVCLLQWLSRGGTHHHESMVVFRQGLVHEEHVAHVEQHGVLSHHVGVACGFYQIHAWLQPGGIYCVAHHLIYWMAVVVAGDMEGRSAVGQLLQGFQVCGRLRVEACVAAHVDTRDGEIELMQVDQVLHLYRKLALG